MSYILKNTYCAHIELSTDNWVVYRLLVVSGKVVFEKIVQMKSTRWSADEVDVFLGREPTHINPDGTRWYF